MAKGLGKGKPKEQEIKAKGKTPSEEQKPIIDKLYKWYNGNSIKPQLLIGPAGSGKTYILECLIQKLGGHCNKSKTILAAPTHKAVKVLQTSSENIKDTVSYTTVHSLFNLVMAVDANGIVSFEKSKSYSFDKMLFARLLIVDEASMLDEQLFNLIVEQIVNKRLKVIFVGDRYQIPPVGKSEAPPFDPIIVQDYKIEQHELNKIMRQENGTVAMTIRQYLVNNIKNPEIDIYQFIDNESIKRISTKHIFDLLEDKFKTPEFATNSDYCKVICWTNNSVNKFNSAIREIIHGRDDLDKIMQNDKLILDSPYALTDSVVLQTNEELLVKSVRIDTVEIHEEPIKIYQAVCEYSTGVMVYEATIKILHEESEQMFNVMLNDMAKQIQKITDRFERVKMWKYFYSIKNQFAQVKYNYAITAHKSQGSTYTYAIVNTPDLMKNPNIYERNRILYTAITRYKSQLYLI